MLLQTGTPVGLIEDKVPLSTFDPPFLKLKHIASQVINSFCCIIYSLVLLIKGFNFATPLCKEIYLQHFHYAYLKVIDFYNFKF